MSLRESLYALEKQAVDLSTMMAIEEEVGPMKARLYKDMVEEDEHFGAGVGLLAGGASGYQASSGLQRRQIDKARQGLDAAEAENLLKWSLAEQALYDPSRLGDVDRLTNEAIDAKRVADEARAHLQGVDRSTLASIGHNGRAALLGGLAGSMGLAALAGRQTHNYLNREESLGAEEQSLISPAAGIAGGVAGGLAGSRHLPRMFGGKTGGGIIGTVLGSGAGLAGADLVQRGLHDE